jgi:hypothetical protein
VECDDSPDCDLGPPDATCGAPSLESEAWFYRHPDRAVCRRLRPETVRAAFPHETVLEPGG